MRHANLSTVALNADTISAASKEWRDLFNSMRSGVSIVLVSPEQLTSKGFERLVDDPDSVFTCRVCLLAVNEAHLMNMWGQSFRQAFQEIGAMRARFPGRLPPTAVTATLQDGAPMQSVCSFLRLQPGHYHFIHRSNSRLDIRLIFRTMKSGLSSTTFPELHWVVKNKERRRILIFACTISLGFCIMVNFWSLLSNDPSRAKQIRLFNAVNDKSYNDQTLALWQSNDSDAQIIIATSILSVGINASTFDDVIVYGEPPDSNEFVQDYGCLQFMKSISPRAFLYMTRTAHSKAQKVMGNSNMVTSKPVPSGQAASGDSMQPSMAKLIRALCKVTQLNELYGNPQDEPRCSCLVCADQPRPQPRSKCDCSGCQKDDLDPKEGEESNAEDSDTGILLSCS